MGFQFFHKPAFRYASAGFAVAIFGYLGYSIGVPVGQEFSDSFAMKEFKQYGVVGTYRNHFFSSFDKFQDLAGLATENENLKAQLALIEKKQTLEDTDRTERDLASMNELLEKKVKEQGGSGEARLPQTLGYEVPPHLMPSQLYTLALAYFRKQEFEKTVGLLDHLFKLPDDRHYETSENYLLSGISWYHLKNYTIARAQIHEANQRSKVYDTVHRQALIWDAMVEKSEGKNQVAQAKLLHFIGEYPHAIESTWINGGRAPARADSSHESGFVERAATHHLDSKVKGVEVHSDDFKTAEKPIEKVPEGTTREPGTEKTEVHHEAE
jgi:tetratricopeptide (TPR) repeat protein